MALEATHIRIAIDLQQALGVIDAPAYLAGTIYPDSRYVTGIDRELTHADALLHADLAGLDDFTRGWLVHLHCDVVGLDIPVEDLPDVFDLPRDGAMTRWTALSALKIMQDMGDAQACDLQASLSLITYPAAPNGEDLAKLARYVGILQRAYADPSTASPETYRDIWRAFGVEEIYVDRFLQKLLEFQADARVTHLAEEMHDRMLERLQSRLGLHA